MVFTTSSVFLQVLVDAGITHAFVNLGSDHPSLLEAFIERQESNLPSLKIVTCPNEMVALSCAQGYAQVCGKAAAVIVHVDCGTQALAGAVHNVSTCRTPVFIYAGASPFSQDDELAGSRNEFIHWLQNAVDQPAILRQYMRHTAEIRSGKNTQQVVLRALQFANSEPKGPVYCWAPREITEEHLDPGAVPDVKVSQHWSPVELSPLNKSTVAIISESLLRAKKPLIITTYLGRNQAAVNELIQLVDLVAVPVFSSCVSTVNIPFDHFAHAGVAFGQPKNPLVEEADFILILDCDVPWIPHNTRPSPTAEIFHIDCDPLKERMAMHAYPCLVRAKADVAIALEQIYDYISASPLLPTLRPAFHARMLYLVGERIKKRDALNALEEKSTDNILTAPYIIGSLRRHCPSDFLVLNEAISNYAHVWNHMVPVFPGSVLSSGASSLGWALGAAIGAKLAGDAWPEHRKELIACVVGDGSFLFGVPSTAYWMARRYDAPFLTIVLNNGGWKSPKLSLLGVHPTGLGSQATSGDLNVSFGPDAMNPDYGGIAAAAGGAWSKKLMRESELEEAMKEAIRVVMIERRCAVLDCWLERF